MVVTGPSADWPRFMTEGVVSMVAWMALSILSRPAPWRARGSSRLLSPPAWAHTSGVAVEWRRQATAVVASALPIALISGWA